MSLYASLDITVQTALQSWAEDAGCVEINLEKSSEFARVWLFCLIGWMALLVMVTVPICWCTRSVFKGQEDDYDQVMPSKKTSCRMESTPQDLRVKVSTSFDPDFDPKPDIGKAQEHLVRMSNTDGDGNWRSIWNTSLDDIKVIGGTGMELYFRLVQYLGFCFLYMAALTFPAASFSAHGHFAPDNGNLLTKTTIGNLGWDQKGHLHPEARYLIIGCQGLPVETLTKYFAWLDMVAVCLFLAFILWFQFWQIPQTAAANDTEAITPKDFSIQIDWLPERIPEQREYAELLKKHLLDRLKWMRNKHKNVMESVDSLHICEVSLVRDFEGQLEAVTNRGNLVRQQSIAGHKNDEKLVKRLQEKINKLSRKLRKEMGDQDDLPVIRAFVILNTPQDVAYLLHDYRFAQFYIFRLCQYRSRRFHGKAIRISHAPEPTSIIWKNQDLPWIWRQVRVCLMFCLFIVIIACAAGLIYAASASVKGQTETSHSFLGHDECDPSSEAYDTAKNDARYKCLVTNATLWTKEYAIASGGEILDCYCSVQGYDKIIKDSSLRYACGDWLSNAAVTILILAGASAAVVLINIVVRITLTLLADFERPLSLSALNSSEMRKIGCAQFICTSVIIHLVNYHYFPLGHLIFRGDYTDFTRGWYAAVGASLLGNMLSNIIGPTVSYMISMLVTAVRRWWYTTKVKSQEELMELYTNPPFDISAKYAQVLMTVLCTMMYSSGLPLLNLFAALYMFMTYWGDKVLLLRGTCRPPHTDSQMAREASHYMFYGVALHCVFAIMMFGQSCSFPSPPLGGKLASLSDQATSAVNKHTTSSSNVVQWWSVRISQESTWMLFVLLAVFIAIWMLQFFSWLLGNTLGGILHSIILAIQSVHNKTVPEEMANMVWDDAKDHIEKVMPPASYDFTRSKDCQEMKKEMARSRSQGGLQVVR